MALHHGVVHYQTIEPGWIGAGRRVGQTRSTGQGVTVVQGDSGPEKTGPWHGSPATVKGSGMKHGSSHGSHNPGKMRGRGGY